VTEARLREKVAPALRSAVQDDPDDEVRGAAMVALAKLGGILSETERREQRELFERNLVHPNQAVVECAIVALGLLGTPECAITLCEIADDSPIGRSLLTRVSVPGRTRALAALSLGLAGSQCEDPEIRRHIVLTLASILDAERAGAADLAVACVTSLGLTPLPEAEAPLEEQGGGVLPAETSRETQVRFLCEKLADPAVREIVRAHVPRALGCLLRGADGALKPIVAETMLRLLDRHRKVEHTVRFGVVFGLGMIGDADADPVDVRIRKALEDAQRDAHVFQQRSTLVAIALVSGRPGSGEGDPFAGTGEARSFLLHQLARGKSRGRPWAALALGLQGFHEIDSGRKPLPAVGSALRDRLASTRAPSDVGALCIALGLSGDQASVPLLLESMQEANGEEARAHAALALGLLGARGAIPALQAAVENASHQPTLLREASIALALLGDKQVVDIVMDRTGEDDSEFTRTAAIHALGYIGDDRAIDLLVERLGQDERSSEVRRFAAVALGMVSETDLEPWTSLYTNALNYTAMTETLAAGESAGILNLR
jgi:HEAT repeat protein